jgi:hypothetical protein
VVKRGQSAAGPKVNAAQPGDRERKSAPLRNQNMGKAVWPIAAAILTISSGTAVSHAQTQVQNVERSFTAQSNKYAQIGVYLNVRPDCTSGPLPTIRLASPPGSGKVIVKTAKVKATNYKACLAIEVPAYVAFYKSTPDFTGPDTMVIEVKYPAGRTEIQKITVKVAGTVPQQKI